MIPVFQTRTTVEEFGNCFEACLASILEVPLSAIPDRADGLDLNVWQNEVRKAYARGGERAVGELEDPTDSKAIDRWLRARGIAWLELLIGKRGMSEKAWLELGASEGYWIGLHRETAHNWTHAVVHKGRDVVHNPMRGVLGDELLGELKAVHLIALADVRLFDRLRSEMLPDIAGELVA